MYACPLLQPIPPPGPAFSHPVPISYRARDRGNVPPAPAPPPDQLNSAMPRLIDPPPLLFHPFSTPRTCLNTCHTTVPLSNTHAYLQSSEQAEELVGRCIWVAGAGLRARQAQQSPGGSAALPPGRPGLAGGVMGGLCRWRRQQEAIKRLLSACDCLQSLRPLHCLPSGGPLEPEANGPRPGIQIRNRGTLLCDLEHAPPRQRPTCRPRRWHELPPPVWEGLARRLGGSAAGPGLAPPQDVLNGGFQRCLPIVVSCGTLGILLNAVGRVSAALGSLPANVQQRQRRSSL